MFSNRRWIRKVSDDLCDDFKSGLGSCHRARTNKIASKNRFQIVKYLCSGACESFINLRCIIFVLFLFLFKGTFHKWCHSCCSLYFCQIFIDDQKLENNKHENNHDSYFHLKIHVSNNQQAHPIAFQNVNEAKATFIIRIDFAFGGTKLGWGK